ncbi:dTMP kinase [Aggregicoccus sp. 17bor-14]|uniref:dTMP kinase n=1 Tax=Myxococcaceae TaxID=31 RepID=UPI0012F0DCC6|nr:dTMP kinase [Simulacricoccus sp. 17bor-14]MRI87279.1 dTMP kinase [Aggregicoccus sp. 17bor-14]
MFIDFEGIDGSGKTTLSNLLAARLKRLGYRVTHAREGGELQSPIARRIRELTRDARLLEMGARTEFFLNLARDAQQLEEVIAPALTRGDVCITDRYLYSQLALSGGGRGLPQAELQPSCELASQGLWPDLVILVDVDPDLARLRKRLGKLKERREKDSDSRKGLVGAGLSVRVREQFRELARQEPSRWLVIENNEQPLWVLEQRIVDAVVARLEGREPTIQRIAAPPAAPAPFSPEPAAIEQRFYDVLDGLETREPALGVFLLGGMPGTAAHKRRLAAAERFPELTARSLTGLFDEAAWDLRELLAPRAPAEVAQSLVYDASARADALRTRLFPLAPRDVLQSLKRVDTEVAWALREHGLHAGQLADVLCGLAGVDTAAAWVMRERGVAAGLYADVARSLQGVAGERADALRERLLPNDRLAVLRSVTGLDSPFASALRASLEQHALKLVMRSLTGLTTDEAFALRERGAARSKEAIDSLDGLDHPRAWALREAYAARWPATVLSSMRGLPLGERTRALLARVLEASPSRLPLLRNACAVVTSAPAPQAPSSIRIAEVAPERSALLAPT